MSSGDFQEEGPKPHLITSCTWPVMSADDPASCVSARVWGRESVFITCYLLCWIVEARRIIHLMQASQPIHVFFKSTIPVFQYHSHLLSMFVDTIRLGRYVSGSTFRINVHFATLVHHQHLTCRK